MNERIKELEKQAEVDVETFGEGFSGPYMVKRVSLEKFAELLIRECMLLSILQSEAGYVSNYIAKHFGLDK
jgi:hypothetical protein